jgi:hypothetical protein
MPLHACDVHFNFFIGSTKFTLENSRHTISAESIISMFTLPSPSYSLASQGGLLVSMDTLCLKILGIAIQNIMFRMSE